jgi:hypothetical protein
MLYLSVHFFACPKKRTKERAPCVSCPAEGGMPGVYAPHGVLLDAAGALQTRCAQTVQIPFSAASPVLGCVPMGILTAYESQNLMEFALQSEKTIGAVAKI